MTIQDMLLAIPWIVAIIGWACTHFLSEARERRKEVRSLLDKLHDQLQQLERDGRNFHTSNTFDGTKAEELTTKVLFIERLLSRINIVSEDQLIPYVVGLRRSISLSNFDASTFTQQSQGSTILKDISWAIQELEVTIEYRYSARYPLRFPYFQMPWSK